MPWLKKLKLQKTTRRLDAFRCESWACVATGAGQATGADRSAHGHFHLGRAVWGGRCKTGELLVTGMPLDFQSSDKQQIPNPTTEETVSANLS